MAMQEMDMMSEGMEGLRSDLEGAVAGLSMEEDALFAEMAPKGSFTKGALNSLVKAHNKVSSLFELDTYPSFTEDIKEFPVQFVKELSMISAAVADAIAEDILDASMAIDLSTVKTDRDIASLAGRLDMIAKSKDFKKFLASPREEEVVMEEEVAPMPEGGEEMDIEALMMERM